MCACANMRVRKKGFTGSFELDPEPLSFRPFHYQLTQIACSNISKVSRKPLRTFIKQILKIFDVCRHLEIFIKVRG